MELKNEYNNAFLRDMQGPFLVFNVRPVWFIVVFFTTVLGFLVFGWYTILQMIVLLLFGQIEKKFFIDKGIENGLDTFLKESQMPEEIVDDGVMNMM